jgi:hypothetical protein
MDEKAKEQLAAMAQQLRKVADEMEKTETLDGDRLGFLLNELHCAKDYCHRQLAELCEQQKSA